MPVTMQVSGPMRGARLAAMGGTECALSVMTR